MYLCNCISVFLFSGQTHNADALEHNMNKQLNSKEKILIAQTQLKFNTELYSKEKVKKEQRNKTMEKLCKQKNRKIAHIKGTTRTIKWALQFVQVFFKDRITSVP